MNFYIKVHKLKIFGFKYPCVSERRINLKLLLILISFIEVFCILNLKIGYKYFKDYFKILLHQKL